MIWDVFYQIRSEAYFLGLSAALKIDTLLAENDPLFFESAVSWFEQCYHKRPEYRQAITRLQIDPPLLPKVSITDPIR